MSNSKTWPQKKWAREKLQQQMRNSKQEKIRLKSKRFGLILNWKKLLIWKIRILTQSNLVSISLISQLWTITTSSKSKTTTLKTSSLQWMQMRTNRKWKLKWKSKTRWIESKWWMMVSSTDQMEEYSTLSPRKRFPVRTATSAKLLPTLLLSNWVNLPTQTLATKPSAPSWITLTPWKWELPPRKKIFRRLLKKDKRCEYVSKKIVSKVWKSNLIKLSKYLRKG